MKAVQVLMTWLERGDCSKKNANTFYSMIQSTNSHVRRLLNEKTQFEEELQKAKELARQRMQGLILQCMTNANLKFQYVQYILLRLLKSIDSFSFSLPN